MEMEFVHGALTSDRCQPLSFVLVIPIVPSKSRPGGSYIKGGEMQPILMSSSPNIILTMHRHRYRVVLVLAVAVGLTNMQADHCVQSQGVEADDSPDVAACLAQASWPAAHSTFAGNDCSRSLFSAATGIVTRGSRRRWHASEHPFTLSQQEYTRWREKDISANLHSPFFPFWFCCTGLPRK